MSRENISHDINEKLNIDTSLQESEPGVSSARIGAFLTSTKDNEENGPIKKTSISK